MPHDTEWTDAPTCPYCGHEETDAWEIEFRNESAEVSCSSCGKDYDCTEHRTFNYTSKPKGGA